MAAPTPEEIAVAIEAAKEPVKIEARRNPPRACRARPLLTEDEKMKILMASDSDSSDDSFDDNESSSDDDDGDDIIEDETDEVEFSDR